MRAYRDAMSLRQGDRPAHHRWITGVKPARDVRRCNARHQLFVRTHLPRAKRLAEIGIEIDPHLSCKVLVFRVEPRNCPAGHFTVTAKPGRYTIRRDDGGGGASLQHKEVPWSR